MGGRFALPVGNGLPDFLGLGRVVKFLVMLGEDMQVRRAARREKPLHPAPHRIERLHEILKDGVGDAFHKGLVVAVGEHIQLEALGFHTLLIGDELHHNRAEVGLPCHGAQGRIFGKRHADDIRTMREAVGEDFQKADARAAFGLRKATGAENCKLSGLVAAVGHGHAKTPWGRPEPAKATENALKSIPRLSVKVREDTTG